MRPVSCFCAAMLLASAALAQQPADLVGRLVQPSGSVVIYTAPQSGLFTKQAPAGIAAPSPGGTTYYQLTPDQGDYVVGTSTPSDGLRVLSRRTIVAGRSIQEWLEVQSGSVRGWILYQPGTLTLR